MKISMVADFKILKNNNGQFVPVTNDTIHSISIGGFSFDVNDTSIPFDWDGFSGNEENGVYRFETGKGFLFNDYELSDCYDDAYKDIGIDKESITAEFLASSEHIEEFFVDFLEKGTDNEVGIGHYLENSSKDAVYKLELVNLVFVDVDSYKEFSVKSDVISAFNKGERGKVLSLDEQISRCAVHQHDSVQEVSAPEIDL